MAGMFGKSAARFDPSGLSGSDKLMLFGAGLRDFGGALSGRDTDALLQLQGMLAQRQQDAAAQEWRRGLFGGQAATQPPVVNSDGEDISAAFSPQGAPQRQGLPSLRDIAPQLLNAPRGVDIRPIVDILDKTSPKAMNVNGRIIDERDPNSIGMEVPETDKGQIRLYDAQGKFAGIRNADGYVQSAAELAGAVKGAEARASAPYEFVNVPTPTGAPAVTSKAGAAGQTFVGQSPVEAIRAEGAARGETERAQALQERAAAAGKQLSALDEMEALLPDVIAGFGSDMRLNTARALALAGNEDAQRKVAATETFINQGRVLVAGIIKTFGANPTEGERKFAEKMSGADATLNPETLKEGIRLQRARINRELSEAGRAQPPTRSRPAPPTLGQVVKGYRYRGGDPSSPNSWVKAQ